MHRRVRQCPCHRERGQAHVQFLGDLLELVHYVQVGAQRLTREIEVRAPPVVLWKFDVGLHPSREQPVGESTVYDHSQVMSCRVWQDLCLNLAAKQMVRRLDGLRSPISSELLQLRQAVVGDAIVAYLSLADEVIQDGRRLLGRGARVGPS